MTDQRYSKTRSPVRKIPTREQLEYAATRQALLEANQEADPSYYGHYAGSHPEHRPYSSTDLTHIQTQRSKATRAPVTFDAEEDFDLEEDLRYYATRPPNSTRRYETRQGSVNVVEHYHQQPLLRAHRHQLPPSREKYTEEYEALPPAKQHKHSIHPHLYLGVGMLAIAALFLLLSSAATWIQTTKDDLTYGRPRTFHIDAVVGHNDSPSNPTHFIAMNLYRHVEVIEIPGQDETKERTFQITTLFGDGEDLTPVTLSFRDLLGNGKLDMLIHIQNQTLVMINEKGTFRPAKPGEVKGLV